MEISEHVGHAMTYKVFTDDTFKVISCSNIHCAYGPAFPNIRANILFPPSHVILLRHVYENSDGEQTYSMPFFDSCELVGETGLMNPGEDGQRSKEYCRATGGS